MRLFLTTDPDKLRAYYGELFGWEFAVGGPVAPSVSETGKYGFTEAREGGIPGGIGGGAGYPGRVLFYVGVSDVEEALARAERLGGKRVMGPENVMEGLVIGMFLDPEGHPIGLAATSTPPA